MQAGQRIKMKRGAIWACAIPVGLGAISLLSLLLASVLGTLSAAELRVLGPIVASFLFVPPLSIWLACRSLAKIESLEKLSRWGSSAGRIVLATGLVYLIFVALYSIRTKASSLNQGFIEALPNIMGSAVIHLILWVIITLPLSILCATIFWKVTKFPDDTTVF